MISPIKRFGRHRPDAGKGDPDAEGTDAPLHSSRSAQLTPEDREFLPAALEILETPPSPIRVAFLWFICMAFAIGLAWSYFGWIDIHAVAQGKIQPSGRSKIVQPLESGKVIESNVPTYAEMAKRHGLLEPWERPA